MSSFYQELAQNHLTKAEALRQAQEKLLRNKNFSHPYYWSAFVLIGNWI
jgi:CHAT domain-containing protein